MLAMVTNDDGIGSEGIAVLAATALASGLEVIVAAPSWNSSGASASLTSVERQGQFLLDERSIAGVDARCVAVEAAPAYIVRAGLTGAFGPIPDLVLSGVNHGANTGHSVLHSGTVGAALTASTLGARAAAFSVDAKSSTDWTTVTSVVEQVLAWMAAHSVMGTVVNVNIPAREMAGVLGICTATLAPFGAVTANVTEIDGDYVTMRYDVPPDEAPEGSDVALLAEGFATVTALLPLCEHAGTDFGNLVGRGTRAG